MRTHCSKCKEPLELPRFGKQGYCRRCHAEYMRLNRSKHSELTPIQKKKANCRSYLNVYIKRGKITKLPCQICGASAEAHHEDYDKPLEVIWLCRLHHLELHNCES